MEKATNAPDEYRDARPPCRKCGSTSRRLDVSTLVDEHRRLMCPECSDIVDGPAL